MPSRKRSPADAPGAARSAPGKGSVHLAGVYQVFSRISCSRAVFDEHGRQPQSVFRCLEKALRDLKEGRLALYRSLQPHQFVSFACGFAIWTSVSPDGSMIAVSELRRQPDGELL